MLGDDSSENTALPFPFHLLGGVFSVSSSLSVTADVVISWSPGHGSCEDLSRSRRSEGGCDERMRETSTSEDGGSNISVSVNDT